MRKPSAIMVFALVAAGCNSSTDGSATDSTESIASSYSIGSGSEAYQCTRVNISATRWIKAFTPTLNNGVYRTWLAVDESPGSQGTSACSFALENDWRLVFVAGVNTGGLTLPDQVGFKLNPGEQLVLLVQLVNNTTGSLAGSASIEMLMAGSPAGFGEAEGFLAGTVLFNIPAAQTVVISGGCTLGVATSIFAVMPYMNKFGINARVWTDMPTQTVIDHAYSHTDQEITTISPYGMDPGDRVRTEFTYMNTTGAAVTFGDSSNDEQSFAMTYVTPPMGVSSPYCLS